MTTYYSSGLNRRDFIHTAGAGAVAAALAPSFLGQFASGAEKPAQKMIGLQVGAVSFFDEGVAQGSEEAVWDAVSTGCAER